MKKLTKITSTAIPIPLNDIDTDQIIPARFLKAIDLDDYADCLFADWRYENKKLVKEFWLNREFKGSILVTLTNFGCGSSREHAAWALKDYGIQIIIALSFADIFKNNALNNGIIPIVLNEYEIEQTISAIIQQPGLLITVDLEKQEIDIPGICMKKFEINPFKKACIINGVDEIDYLVKLRPDVEFFEKSFL
ncbi:3-isopropylmalate dehydratase small subunit [Putridiphycobacter roseus]|uniref:3-isopropylmalate dehydratase small subunit n=1 Tax=Putridiphycobacter roseus TaxID=2219161 RepID=A0A2W1MUN5_9FLAO|nr:3-isopropylmalate dehydratase small subunit [Putridiphycobacter roseus]PZE15769.1 3-isopropylmalate dehydratase small subunit [Putridiphycobacter roseus]